MNLCFREDEGEEGAAVGKPPEDFSVFDALRDTIYSEVATLIANNENRPHFLVRCEASYCIPLCCRCIILCKEAQWTDIEWRSYSISRWQKMYLLVPSSCYKLCGGRWCFQWNPPNQDTLKWGHLDEWDTFHCCKYSKMRTLNCPKYMYVQVRDIPLYLGGSSIHLTYAHVSITSQFQQY